METPEGGVVLRGDTGDCALRGWRAVGARPTMAAIRLRAILWQHLDLAF